MLTLKIKVAGVPVSVTVNENELTPEQVAALFLHSVTTESVQKLTVIGERLCGSEFMNEILQVANKK